MRLSRLVKISWVIILLQQLIPESFRLPIFQQKYYGCYKQSVVINLYQQCLSVEPELFPSSHTGQWLFKKSRFQYLVVVEGTSKVKLCGWKQLLMMHVNCH